MKLRDVQGVAFNEKIDGDENVTSRSNLIVDDCRSLSGKTLFFNTNTYMSFSKYLLSNVPESENNEIYMSGTVSDYDVKEHLIRAEYILSKCMSFSDGNNQYTMITMYSYNKKTNDTREVLVVFKKFITESIRTIIYINKFYKHQVTTLENFITKLQHLIQLSQRIHIQIKQQLLFNPQTLTFSTIDDTKINFTLINDRTIEGSVIFNDIVKFDIKMIKIDENYIYGYEAVFNILDKDNLSVGNLIVNIRDDKLVFFFKMDIDTIDFYSSFEMAKKTEIEFNEYISIPSLLSEQQEKIKAMNGKAIVEVRPSQQIVHISKSLKLHVTNIPSVPCELAQNFQLKLPYYKKIPNLKYTFHEREMPILNENKKSITNIFLTIMGPAIRLSNGYINSPDPKNKAVYIKNGLYNVKSNFTVFFEDSTHATFHGSTCFYDRQADGSYQIEFKSNNEKFGGDFSIRLLTRNLKDDYEIIDMIIPFEIKDKFIQPQRMLADR